MSAASSQNFKMFAALAKELGFGKMNKDNPACYECPKTKSRLHHWTRRDDKTAYCIKCDTELTEEQADDVWMDMEAARDLS